MRYLRTFILILKQIKTRPTKFFIFLVLAIVGLFLLAYMHNYNIVYLMMFFTFALAGASSLIGRLNLYELQVSLFRTDAFFANKTASYTLSLYNPNSHKDSFALECSNTDTSVTVNELPALQEKRVSLPFTPKTRGKAILPTFRLGTHFPLPHELLYKDIDLNHDVIVYPEPKGRSLESLSNRDRFFVGEYDDFEGIRNYSPGESMSLIHWPSLAKTQELMSKDFSLLEKSKHLHFYFSKAAQEDEARLSQLCLWAIECHQRSIDYTIHFPHTKLDSTTRSHHEILEFLALY